MHTYNTHLHNALLASTWSLFFQILISPPFLFFSRFRVLCFLLSTFVSNKHKKYVWKKNVWMNAFQWRWLPLMMMTVRRRNSLFPALAARCSAAANFFPPAFAGCCFGMHKPKPFPGLALRAVQSVALFAACFHPQSCWSVHQKGDDRERPEGGTLPGVIQSGARALSFCSLSHVARKRRLVLESFALFSEPLAHELHLKNAKILPRFYWRH